MYCQAKIHKFFFKIFRDSWVSWSTWFKKKKNNFYAHRNLLLSMFYFQRNEGIWHRLSTNGVFNHADEVCVKTRLLSFMFIDQVIDNDFLKIPNRDLIKFVIITEILDKVPIAFKNFSVYFRHVTYFLTRRNYMYIHILCARNTNK